MMQEKDESPFSRLMSIGLGLNVAARRASGKIKKDEELAKFLDMFSYSEYIFLEIDVSFFYPSFIGLILFISNKKSKQK